VAVSAEVARRGTIQQTLAYSGEIRSTHSISVAPKASGRVEGIAVNVGSQVKAGDAIAWLERGSVQIQLSQLSAARAAAQARLDTVRAGARAEDVEAAQAALAQQQVKLQNLRSGGRSSARRNSAPGRLDPGAGCHGAGADRVG
jgi:HlyD family secretion protein